jgi:altronate dehydratase
MPDIIDFNTGDIIDGEASIEGKGEALLDFVINIASEKLSPKLNYYVKMTLFLGNAECLCK